MKRSLRLVSLLLAVLTVLTAFLLTGCAVGDVIDVLVALEEIGDTVAGEPLPVEVSSVAFDEDTTGPPETAPETEATARDLPQEQKEAAEAVEETTGEVTSEEVTTVEETTEEVTTAAPDVIDENGSYTSKEDVALYLHTYGHLPSNFITKKEAEELGWISSKGNLWKVADGKSIGGDYFGNREGLLPSKKGRKWYECDVNYDGGFRGGERILYSNDGLIYYTDDHYASYTQLY